MQTHCIFMHTCIYYKSSAKYEHYSYKGETNFFPVHDSTNV